MGGYAALKYSNLLQADIVIALCPQWSIDPVECNGNKSGYEAYCEPSMSGMGIIKEDLSGKIFVFYDPRHLKDAFHVRSIQRIGYPVEVIHVPHSGHHITPVLAGTKAISEIIYNAELGDVNGLKTVASVARRSSVKRAQIVIERSSFRHPAMCGMLLTQSRHLIKLDPNTSSNVDNNILSKIDTQKHPEISLAVLKRIMARNGCADRAHLLSSLYRSVQLKTLNGLTDKIQTYHNTFVCYDLASGKLIHKSESEIKENPSIFKYVHPFRLVSGGVIAAIISGGDIYVFILEKPEMVQLKLLTPESQNHDKCVMITKEGSKVCLRVFGNYACANRRGRLEFNRSSASHWGNFEIIPYC